MGEEHFNPYKGENDHEAVIDKTKLSQHPGNQKIHGTQPQDSQNIRAKYNKRVCRDGQDSGDAIQCKEDVRELYDDQRNEKGRSCPNPEPVDKKMIAIHARGYGKYF